MPEGTPRVCAFDGCESHVFGRGWCSAHYMQWYKGKPLTPVKRRNRPGVEKVEPGSARACIVEGCVRQPKGQRARDLLAWAEEIVARYGPERAKL